MSKLADITQKHLPTLPTPKLEQKTKDFILGWIWVIVGVGLIVAGVVVALKVSNLVLVCVFVGGGIFMLFYGSNIISREISRAARKEAVAALGGVTSSLGGLLGRGKGGDA